MRRFSKMKKGVCLNRGLCLDSPTSTKPIEMHFRNTEYFQQKIMIMISNYDFDYDYKNNGYVYDHNHDSRNLR